MNEPTSPSANCGALIGSFEGCERARPDGRFDAYLCPRGIPTIGKGSTGPDIKLGLVWTRDQCEARFERDLQHFGAQVVELLRKDARLSATSQNQFDAMVSFAYNLGTADLATSTLLKRHLSGLPASAKAEFLKWDHAGKAELLGLKRRRAAEAMLYGTPDGGENIAEILKQAEKVTL